MSSSTDDFEQLKAMIASNPNRAKGLDVPRKIRSIEGEHTKPLNFPGVASDWLEYNVGPAGLLSALCFLRNPLYGQAARGLRERMLLEFRTEAQVQIDRELQGASKLGRMKRKVYEWVAADPATLSPQTIREAWEVLVQVFKIQTVILQEIPGRTEPQLSFAPANTELWSADKPIYVVEAALSKVWVYSGSQVELRRSLAMWISDREQAGATITWPVRDGTKAELVEYMEVLPSWRSEYAKLKKDDLAGMAGRASTIERFASWQTLRPEQRLFLEE